MFGGSSVAGQGPAWKAGVPRDSGTSWDFEDVRDFYVGELFGVDPLEVRYADPDWALDLGRAAVAEIDDRGDERMAPPRLDVRGRDRAGVAGPLAGRGLGTPRQPWAGPRRRGTRCGACSIRSRCSLTDEGLSGLQGSTS